MKKLLAVVVMVAFLAAPACARQPKAATGAKVIGKYFKKYGKKYKQTIFWTGGGIREVEVTKQEEIHKNLAAIQAFITLKDSSVQRVSVSMERGPFGWRFVSWENDTNL